METLFLACFLFGVVFSAVSLALGVAGGHGVHPGHGAPLDSGGHGAPHAPALPHAAGHDVAHSTASAPDARGQAGHPALPVLNLTSLVVFLTWAGAAGYVALHYGAWPLATAALVAVVAGASGSVIIALFLGRVLAGERVMAPRDYRLEGTLARVSVTIPPNGVGEVLFSLAGARRSEAARGLTPATIARGTEVVILAYAHGIATVQAWEDFVQTRRPETQEGGPPSAAQ